MIGALKKKIMIIGLLVLFGIATFTGVSYAWLTISTNPEVSGMSAVLYSKNTLLLSADGENYSQCIDISDRFAGYVGLKPVSTVDGINWFLPTYSNGELNSPSQFILDNTLEHANVLGVDEDGEPLIGTELIDAMKNGYYVYADFWMKSEEDEGCKVRLSIPGNEDELDDWEYEQGSYGTYVLPKIKSNGTSGYTDVSNSSITSVRVGFLVYDEEQYTDGQLNEDAEPSAFVIYEPNANLRCYVTENMPGGANEYVIGYQYDSTSYNENYYFETKPIALIQNDDETVTYAEVSIPSDSLIIQKACDWDYLSSRVLGSDYSGVSLLTKLSNNVRPNSNDVLFSQFYDTAIITGRLNTAKNSTPSRSCFELDSSINGSMRISGSNIIYNLDGTSPVMVRLFVWIEGQDVDCWNDIATGSFTVNLELAGETN